MKIMFLVILFFFPCNKAFSKDLEYEKKNIYSYKDIDSLSALLTYKISELDHQIISLKDERERHMSFLSYITTFFISITGIILVVSGWRSYIVSNESVKKASNAIASSVHKTNAKAIKKLESDIDIYRNYIILKILLSNTDDMGSIINDIFPLLTNIIKEPKEEFKPLFNKLIELNIDSEITEKAKEGMGRIM